jgi:hypothetical protein
VACGAEARQVGGKAVGEVHQGSGEMVCGEPLSDFEAWHGIEMFLHEDVALIDTCRARLKEAESVFGFAETPGDKDSVARFGTATADGSASFHFANHRNVDENLVAAGGVASSNGAMQSSGGAAESSQKLIEPSAGAVGWKREAEQEAARLRAHCGDIADSARKAFPSNGIGGMAVDEKMSAFEKPVTGEDGFEAGPRTPDGGVVSHAEWEFGGLGGGRKVQASEALNQQILVWP